LSQRRWSDRTISRTGLALAARERLVSHLASTASYPVRVVCAPVGSGKTTAVRQYIAHTGERAAYVRVPVGASVSFIKAELERRHDSDELAIDDADRMTPEAADFILERIVSGADSRRFILVGASRGRMRSQAILARGFGVLVDAKTLAFDRNEIAEYASLLGVPCNDDDVTKLLHDTDGWPVAVVWIMREAANAGQELRDAYDTWCERHGHLLLEFIAEECAHDRDALQSFDVFLRATIDSTQRVLERLEALGFPIVRTGNILRPYRIISALVARPPEDTSDGVERAAPLMRFDALGTFRCEIAGRPVAFKRRRDQNVFTYVALARDLRTSREELLQAFWPGVDRTVAAQNLRTTISRIRRAIAEMVGAERVDYYVSSLGEVRIDPNYVVIDVRRFLEHVRIGRLKEGRGQLSSARRHYGAAEKLYAGSLLASEPIERCFDRQVVDLEAAYGEVLSKLAHMSAPYSDDSSEDAQQRLERFNGDIRERRLRMQSNEDMVGA
jgi:hypothetical protein